MYYYKIYASFPFKSLNRLNFIGKLFNYHKLFYRKQVQLKERRYHEWLVVRFEKLFEMKIFKINHQNLNNGMTFIFGKLNLG